MEKMNAVTIATYPNGGKVEKYTNGRYNPNDIIDIENIANIRAYQDGVTVQILPAIDSPKDPDYSMIFPELVGTEYEGKCPDMRVITRIGSRTYVEYESYRKPFSMKKVTKMLSRGAEQASNIIIDIRGTKVTNKSVRDRVQNLRQQKSFTKTINSVWLYNGFSIEKVI